MVFVRFRALAQEEWRLGMAVTKKTGHAVQRNRVKRVLREFFRLNQAQIPSGLDLVVVPRRTLQPERLTLALAQSELCPVLAELRRLAVVAENSRTNATAGGAL